MLAETITEWTEQWKAEGRIEEKFNTIKKLYSFNMPLEQISIVVNLSIDKIKKILEVGEKGMALIQEQELNIEK